MLGDSDHVWRPVAAPYANMSTQRLEILCLFFAGGALKPALVLALPDRRTLNTLGLVCNSWHSFLCVFAISFDKWHPATDRAFQYTWARLLRSHLSKYSACAILRMAVEAHGNVDEMQQRAAMSVHGAVDQPNDCLAEGTAAEVFVDTRVEVCRDIADG